MIGLGLSPFNARFRGGYGAYTTAWYNEVLSQGGTATPTELTALTTFETELGSDITEFDRLGIMGLQNEIAARVDFVNPTSTMLTLVNSPTFTAGQGFTGNGTNMYIDTNYNATTNAVNFSSLNRSLGYYSRTNNSSNGFDIGCFDGSTGSYSAPKSSNFIGALGGGNGSGIAVADTSGFFALSKTTTTLNFHKNGVNVGSEASATDTQANLNFFLLALNLSGSASFHDNRQLSLYSIGSGAIDQSNFYTAVQNLGTTLGWAV